jgi:hypothetical protein
MEAEDGIPTLGEARSGAGGLSTRTPVKPARRRAGLFDWLTSATALREARAAVPERDARSRELERRARLACELAERVFEPVDRFRAGPGTAPAIDLYRQAAYWALLVSQPSRAIVSPAELWTSAEPQLQWAVPDPSTRAALRSLFVDMTFIDIAEQSDDEQRRMVLDAQALALAALEVMEHPQRAVNRLLIKRLARWVAIAAVALGALTASLWALDARRLPDLAKSKHWRASSAWAVCEPEARRCGGLSTDIFFHTREDESPWIEYDLGKPTRFSSVFVKNRSDDAPDRAIPLVVEISNDKKKWRELARRKESFRTWTARFKPQTARYVRLRVARRSYLHLEQVSIHP